VTPPRGRQASPFTGQTIEAARRALTARLSAARIESAALDARLLLGAVLDLDLTGMIASADRPLAAADAALIEGYAARRIDGEPIARILGTKEFWGLPFKLSQATLTPRPDTETVVELALEFAASAPAPRILDIGTGSGAILLALLSECPGATGVGADISPAALVAARRNARDFGLSSRAAFVACDYAAALSGGFDLIVSNPPYVRSADIPKLDPEVRDHDPHAALDGGRDGLDAYRALIPQAARLLKPGGALVVEAGLGQACDIEGLMTAAGLQTAGSRADLAGVLRAIPARKMPL
jgi:release factor glutamine methyltransferase